MVDKITRANKIINNTIQKANVYFPLLKQSTTNLEEYKSKLEMIQLTNNYFPLSTNDPDLPCLSSFADKLKHLSSKITYGTAETKIRELLKSLTWPERNLIEIISIPQNCNSIFAYNPYLNSWEEVEIDKEIFPDNLPVDHSFINILPYIFLTGGSIQEKAKQPTNTKKFYRLRRIDDKKFEYKTLPPMLVERSNHSMIYSKRFNNIYVISGENLKSCEYYNFDTNTWNEMPYLNSGREEACCCIINEKELYVFFGYDRWSSKYLTTIEKIDLDINDCWWNISIPGNQSIFKKRSIGILNLNNDEILLCGGINSLRNESKDIIMFDSEKDTVEVKKEYLPGNSSFTHSGFIQMFDGLYYSVTNGFSIIRFFPETKTFSFLE